MRKIALCLLCIAYLSGGCFKKENDCAPRNIVAPAPEVMAVADYLNGQGINATAHASGLFYSVLQDGTGTIPNICSDVRVGFRGTLRDGTVFEQNNDVVLNLKFTIESWRIALPMFKAGAKIRLFVPPTLGYGSAGKKDASTNTFLVPPNTPVIIYDITLYEVK